MTANARSPVLPEASLLGPLSAQLRRPRWRSAMAGLRRLRPSRTCRCDKSFFLCSCLRTIIARCQTIQARYLRQHSRTSPMHSPLHFAFRAASVSTTPTNSCRAIVAKRLVEHLERSGFVVMKEAADRRRRGAGTGTPRAGARQNPCKRGASAR
jgi:hypothetical protein